MTTSVRTAGVALVATLVLGSVHLSAAADKTAEQKDSKAASPAPAAPPASRVRDSSSRPVLGLLRSPATLLMTAQEKTDFARLPDTPHRRVYVEQFWKKLAPNCPAGMNPNREKLQQRVAEASEKYSDEGVPGWISDRGSIHVLLGAPKAADVRNSAAGSFLVWTYENPARTFAFSKERLSWRFARGVEGNPDVPFAALTEQIAAEWRTHGCELTPEAQSLAWRTSLYEITGRIQGGEKVDVTNPVEPTWHFFPAEGESTLTMLTVALPAALPPGTELKALMRQEGTEDVAFAFGTQDVPFTVHSAAEGVVAQSMRALPPAKYSVAIAAMNDKGEIVTRFAGQQLVVRLGSETLRLSSVIVAEQMKPLAGPDAQKVAPFQIAGYEVVPRPSRVVRHGETITFLGVVVGASGSPSVDLKVTYQLMINPPGRGWSKAGRPIEVEHHTSTVIARDYQVVKQWPEAEYKLAITIVDNKNNGATATQEVPFRVKGGE